LKIRTILNGQVMQDWNTNDMIFDVPSLIQFLSGSTTLLPGTVISRVRLMVWVWRKDHPRG